MENSRSASLMVQNLKREKFWKKMMKRGIELEFLIVISTKKF